MIVSSSKSSGIPLNIPTKLSDGLIVALAEDPSRVSGFPFSTRLFTTVSESSWIMNRGLLV